MAYFSPADHQSLMLTAERGTNRDNALQLVYDKFFELHKSLHRRLRDHNYDLHPHWERASTLSNHSATFSGKTDVLALPYFRSREQAQLVERLMGRDNLDYQSTIEIYRHPIIELRLTPDCFAVELVLSPSAWWDQQNFVGKLARGGISRISSASWPSSATAKPSARFCSGWTGITVSASGTAHS
jgi:hypothetical protein